ncbi:MAG: DMT family transporter [Nitrosopumilus sp.]|nr:DMT family transporter [Nitrosopumilus sp.]
MIGYISAILSAVLFGSVSTVAKPALVSIHPILLASFVYFLASLVATPLIGRAKFSISNKDKILLLVIALSGAVVGPTLFFIGLEDTTASDSALLLNGEIIFSVFLAILLFKEKLPRIGYLAVGLVVAGIVVVTTDLEFSNSMFDVQNSGNFFIIAATLFWALDNNLSKILSTRLDVARIVQLKSLIGGSILLALVFLLQIPIDVELEHLPNILLLGTAGFGASIFFFLHGLKRIGTVKTIMIFSTSSVFGLIFASLLLQEEISNFQLVAMGVILSGFYLLYKKQRGMD